MTLEDQFEGMSERLADSKERQRTTPWDHQKPIRDWTSHGLRCIMLDGPMSMNGYVFVPVEHPWYAIHYSECSQDCDEKYCDHTPESVIEVHGGLTFSHLGNAGWIFGFDTCHAGDFMITPIGIEDGKHWYEDNVVRETEKMAKQLSEVIS